MDLNTLSNTKAADSAVGPAGVFFQIPVKLHVRTLQDTKHCTLYGQSEF